MSLCFKFQAHRKWLECFKPVWNTYLPIGLELVRGCKPNQKPFEQLCSGTVLSEGGYSAGGRWVDCNPTFLYIVMVIRLIHWYCMTWRCLSPNINVRYKSPDVLSWSFIFEAFHSKMSYPPLKKCDTNLYKIIAGVAVKPSIGCNWSYWLQ